MIHIGKRIPKWLLKTHKEVAGSIHLGKGVWMFKLEKKK